MLGLPKDVWLLVFEFLRSGALTKVCTYFWQTLKGQHICCSCAGDHSLQQIQNCHSTLRTLTLRGQQLGPGGARELATLRQAKLLHTLRLDLQGSKVGDSGVEALAEGLSDAPSLHTLHLDLTANDVGSAGACALGGLSQARLLHTIHLDLGANSIQDSGTQVPVFRIFLLSSLPPQSRPSRRSPSPVNSLALSPALPGSPHPTSFVHFTAACLPSPFLAPAAGTLPLLLLLAYLPRSLPSALPHSGPTQALCGLKDAPQLRSLCLNLAASDVTPAGAQALAALKGAPALQTLRINLQCNAIRNPGVHGLAALSEVASLRTLHLDLSANQLGPSEARSLAALGAAPLHTLHLDLENNQVHESCVRPLVLPHSLCTHNSCASSPPPPGLYAAPPSERSSCNEWHWSSC